MQFDAEAGPTRVLIVSEKYELPEPLNVDRLLVDDLDTNQLSAVTAATVLEEVTSRLLDTKDGAERASKALATAESSSARAGKSRASLAVALEQLDSAVADLADAKDALEFHWPRCDGGENGLIGQPWILGAVKSARL